MLYNIKLLIKLYNNMYVVNLLLLDYLFKHTTGDYYFYGRNTNHPCIIINPKHKSQYNTNFGKITLLPL